MKTIKWTKPSGMKIEINDKEANVAYCESMGWKRENEKKPRKNKNPEELKKIEEEKKIEDEKKKAEASASGALTDIPNESNR